MIYGIKDSANLTILHKAGKNAGKIFAYADYATSTTNEWSSDQVYAHSKDVNAIRWDYNKNSTLQVEMEIFDLRMIAMLAGSGVDKVAKDIFKREVLTLDESKKTTIAGTVKEGSMSVYELEADGLTNGAELVATTDYTISKKEITVTKENLKEGDRIVVYYMENVAETTSFTISADEYPENFEVYADTLIRKVDGEDEFVQIHYFNVKPQSAFTITMDASTVTTLSVTFDVLKDTASRDMAEYVIYGAKAGATDTGVGA